MPAPRLEGEGNEPEDRKNREGVPSVSDSLIRTVEQLCAAMVASGVVVGLRDPQGLRCLASAGNAPPVGSRLHPDSAFTRECLETREVVLCEDTENDARIRPSVARSLGLRSAVAVPIEAHGALIGIIEVFWPQPSGSGILAADAATLKEVAEALAPILGLHAAPSSPDLASPSAPDLASDSVPDSAPAVPSLLAESSPDFAPDLTHIGEAIEVGSAPGLAGAKAPEDRSASQESIATNWFPSEQAFPVEQTVEPATVAQRYPSSASTAGLPSSGSGKGRSTTFQQSISPLTKQAKALAGRLARQFWKHRPHLQEGLKMAYRKLRIADIGQVIRRWLGGVLQQSRTKLTAIWSRLGRARASRSQARSAETPAAQTGLTGAASSNPARASKKDAKRSWIARIASFLILTVSVLLSLVGLRFQTSKPFSAANVAAVSVWPRRSPNVVGSPKERAQNAAKTQSATHRRYPSPAAAPLSAASAASRFAPFAPEKKAS